MHYPNNKSNPPSFRLLLLLLPLFAAAVDRPQTKHRARCLTTALAFVVNSVRSAVPDSLPAIGNVVDRATLDKEYAEAEKKGVPTHSFDADASPQQKAAQAGKGREKLDSVNRQPPQDRGESFSL